MPLSRARTTRCRRSKEYAAIAPPVERSTTARLYVQVQNALADTYPVTHDDVWRLLENGFEIVNRYNGVFFSTHFMREILGLDDYEKVLRILQDRVEMREAQLEVERQRAIRDVERSEE